MDKDGSKVSVLFNAADYAVKVKIPESSFKINEVRGYAIAGIEKKEDASAGTDDPFAAATPADDPFAAATTSTEEKPAEVINADNFIVDGQEITFPARSVIVLK